MEPETPGPRVWRRRIGSYAGEGDGPIIVAVCGIHGNEPAGALAAEQVLEELRKRRPAFRGEFVAFGGNLAALAAGRRYLDRDLNRQWNPARVEELGDPPASGVPSGHGAEDAEQAELWHEIRAVFARSRRPVLLIDLHTSSAPGAPFATMGDTLRNRRFVRKLPIPVVMGLEEVIDGSLLEFVNNLGHVTVGVEGGKHDDPASCANHVAFLWLVLQAAGCLADDAVPDAPALRERLRRATEGIPRLVEIRHRHAIKESDAFRMKRGYTNFDPVRRGEELGIDARGAVRARESGVILLPLYQGLGDDGFFLGRAVSAFRLEISSLLRRLRAQALPPLLPGVRRHPDQARTLIVSPRAARVYPIDWFQMLGFRKLRWSGGELVLTRRREGPEA